MLRRIARAVVLVAALVFAAAAEASEFPQIDQLVSKVEIAVRAWQSADAELATTRTKNEELAHRIAALKRLREQQRFSQNATLEKLLQESVTASEQLTSQASLRTARRTE